MPFWRGVLGGSPALLITCSYCNLFLLLFRLFAYNSSEALSFGISIAHHHREREVFKQRNHILRRKTLNSHGPCKVVEIDCNP